MDKQTNVSRITLEFFAGSDIVDACREVSATVALLQREVEFTFNGVHLTASPTDTAADLVNRYWIHKPTEWKEATDATE